MLVFGILRLDNLVMECLCMEPTPHEALSSSSSMS